MKKTDSIRKCSKIIAKIKSNLTEKALEILSLIFIVSSIGFRIMNGAFGIMQIKKIRSFLGKQNSFNRIYTRISNGRRRQSHNLPRIIRIFRISDMFHDHRWSTGSIRLLECIAQCNIRIKSHSLLSSVVENPCNRRLVCSIFFFFFNNGSEIDRLIH